jgi:hypothetical protein
MKTPGRSGIGDDDNRVFHRRVIIAVFLLIAFSASCRRTATSTAIDPALSSCVPPGTTLLAGADLTALRASPLYQRLSPTARAIFEPFRDADYLLLASNGRELLAIARGRFRQAPAGAALLNSHLALAGSPALVTAATAQHKTDNTGAPELVANAESIAASKQIWLVVPGDTVLPLSGNLANVNRLMRDMEFAALYFKLDPQVDLALTARGRTPASAQRFEETLRATISLAAAADAREKDIAALLHAIRIERNDRDVHATLAAGMDDANRLLGLVAP